MRKLLVNLLPILFFSLATSAQSPCGILSDKESGFNQEANKFLALQTQTTAAKAAFAASYRQYKDFFTTEVQNGFGGSYETIAAYMGLKAVTAYCFYTLQGSGNENELLKETQWAYDKLLPFIDFGDDFEIKCNASSNSRITITLDEYRKVGSGLISMACEAAFRIGKPNTTMRFFMGGNYYMNGYASKADVFLATGQILRNRLDRGLVDDTTFLAAYFHLKSSRELNSVDDISRSWGRSFQKEALAVLTDNRFLKYKAPETKHGRFYYHPYASYYQDLYAYLKTDSTQRNQYLQQGILKMLLKTWLSNDKNGLDFIHFSEQLTSYGTHATEQIIAAGDRELMELVADFINKGFDHKNYDYLNYCAYLLYNSLGMEKKANKIYKRVDKGWREKLPTVEAQAEKK